MFHSANYFPNPYVYPHLIAGALIALLGAAVFVRERRSPASVAFLVLTLTVSGWQWSYVCIFSSGIRTLALQWVRVEMLFVSAIPTCVLAFALAVIGRLRQHRWIVAASALLSVWFGLDVAAGDGVVGGVWEKPWGYYLRFGPASFAYLAFFAAALAVSAGFLASAAGRATSGVRRRRLVGILQALGVGYFASVDYLAAFGAPVYPFGFVPILGFVALSAAAIRRYHLADITPEFAAKPVIDTMGDALLVLDDEGRVRLVNPAARVLFAADEQALLGRSGAELLPGLLGEADRRALAAGGPAVQREIEISSGGGAPLLVSVTVSAMRAGEGEVAAYVCLARDVTAYRRAIESLTQKKIELARSSAEREQLKLFAYAASHDLREPLNKIISFGDLLAEAAGPALDGRSADYLRRMQAGARRMSALIDALLNLSRVTSAEAAFAPVDLEAAVRDVLADLEDRVRAAGAVVDVADLPVVRADRSQMYDLFQNLISNAIKFRRPGGPPPHVEVRGRSGPAVAEIMVRDNGIGFEGDQSEKIFKPFHRLHPRDRYEGHGLGLAICGEIVRRHGGRIRAESQPGKGAAFFIELPVAAEAPRPA